MKFLRRLFFRPDPATLHHAGYSYMLTCLQAGLNPVSLLRVLEAQRRPGPFDRGAASALKSNPAVVRALLARHYG